MSRRKLEIDVFTAAVERMVKLYEEGHRIVVSFSAGKDSGVCLELCLIAARLTGRLPVDVVMRDEEIMFPGTFEYAERVACREEVNFVWLVANQPIINAFNRHAPYFWVFDPALKPEEWVRQPPELDCVTYTKSQHIGTIVGLERFPPAPGKDLIDVTGLRTQESVRRVFAIHSSGGYMTKPNKLGVRRCRPIYDWLDGDVWKAVHDNKWDYNHAYDVMARLGVRPSRLRIAPPTLNAAGVYILSVAAKAWPQWFEKVCARLPGVRSAALFGPSAVGPSRQQGETWEECFERTCVREAPPWIAARSITIRDAFIKRHAAHSTTPFPEVSACTHCTGGSAIACYKKLCKTMYDGDPFSQMTDHYLPYVEPEFFRAGAGTWGGAPSW